MDYPSPEEVKARLGFGPSSDDDVAEELLDEFDQIRSETPEDWTPAPDTSRTREDWQSQLESSGIRRWAPDSIALEAAGLLFLPIEPNPKLAADAGRRCPTCGRMFACICKQCSFCSTTGRPKVLPSAAKSGYN